MEQREVRWIGQVLGVISTLAPSHGATRGTGKDTGADDNFNSRLFSWGDSLPGVIRNLYFAFQLSPLLEGRLQRELAKESRKDFNSRTYSRGDQEAIYHMKAMCDFNSRPFSRGDIRGF